MVAPAGPLTASRPSWYDAEGPGCGPFLRALMFDSLSEKLQSSLDDLRSRGKLTEADLDRAMREIRLALLEADVNFRVVKDFVAKVRERAEGTEVLESLTPGQQVVKIVLEELTALMGEGSAKLEFAPQPSSCPSPAGPRGESPSADARMRAVSLRSP